MFILLGKNICKNALDALDECHHHVFPILHEVLCIICSLPISVVKNVYKMFNFYS